MNSGFSSGLPGVDPAQSALPPPPPIGNRNPTPPPGWNDPPPLSSSMRHPKTEASKVAPITHPIFGTMDSNQNGYMNPNSQYPQSNLSSGPQVFNPTPTQQPLQQQQPLDNQNYFSSGPNQMNFKTQAISNQGYHQQSQDIMQQQQQPQQQQHSMQQQRQPETPKQKPPLPEEYMYMQTVLEELKSQCLNVASDLRTKKKVQDVTKRLEYLYDTLTERRLSQNTINALNQIVQFLQSGDYGNALAAHTQIVSGPDFSQTANFMPGIKVLVQTASELKVYLQ